MVTGRRTKAVQKTVIQWPLRTDAGRQTGLTLIELLIAMTLFAVGILSVAVMQGTSLYALATAHGGNDAMVSAGNRLEDLFSRPYEDPLLLDSDGDFTSQTPDHGPFRTGGRATIEWEVADEFPVHGAKRIRVVVQMAGRGGRCRRITYDYLRAKALE